MNAVAAEALTESLEALRRALERFEEALARPETATDPLLRGGLIQRFEFTFEQFWKTLRTALTARDVPSGNSPRAVLQAAYGEGWISEEAPWIAMIRDRNRTSHTYREDVALQVVAQLPRYRDLIAAMAARLPALVSPPPGP
jgi:nucleotidyltransferase substrate binding protein (TIGR01987 family)